MERSPHRTTGFNPHWRHTFIATINTIANLYALPVMDEIIEAVQKIARNIDKLA